MNIEKYQQLTRKVNESQEASYQADSNLRKATDELNAFKVAEVKEWAESNSHPYLRFVYDGKILYACKSNLKFQQYEYNDWIVGEFKVTEGRYTRVDKFSQWLATTWYNIMADKVHNFTEISQEEYDKVKVSTLNNLRV